jgi:hypothetical protein
VNLKTNHVIKSRDIIWSNKTYGEWMKSKDNPKMTEDDLSDTELGYNFGLKVEDHLTDHLSCQIIANYDNKMLFIMQPHLKITETFLTNLLWLFRVSGGDFCGHKEKKQQQNSYNLQMLGVFKLSAGRRGYT